MSKEKELWEQFVSEMDVLEFTDESCGLYDAIEVWDIIEKYRKLFNREDDK